ncbi:MAG TPA: dipeptidase [Steroidobacteraceae bacterium]|nr:dipeptidase [Steroidobacteraceae bacterium]
MPRLTLWARLACALAAALITAPAPAADADAQRIARILAQTPLIDGHNDLPWEIRIRFGGDLGKVDLSRSTLALPAPADSPPLMTDIPRLRAGHVGGQFWSVYIPIETQGPAAVQMTIEQIDIVRQMCARYPNDLTMAYTAADVARAHKAGRIAALIGVEGGHQINNSLDVLRAYYDLGARYMTLTHSSNTAWADSATDNPAHHGLTAFGKEVVREMNRLGMLVDLSHVSAETMRAALAVSEAPVIYSHSSARALVDHPRDVPDDILRLVAANGGVVMVNFYPGYVSEARRRWDADRAAEVARYNSPPFGGLYIGQPERARAALADWERAHPKPPVGIGDVADHIDHIARVAGPGHVGLGSDFDGIPEAPAGLDGVDKYPALLQELARRGWSDADLAAVAGGNALRVLGKAEQVSARLRATRAPSTATLAGLDGMAHINAR